MHPQGSPSTPDENENRASLSGWGAVAQTLTTLGRLKRLRRTGWLDRGVPVELAESVADHTFRVALLSWMVAIERRGDSEAAVDPSRVLLIALAHDLPEAIAGDPTPYGRSAVPPSSDPPARRAFLQRRQERDPGLAVEKRRAETLAMESLLAELPVSIAEQLRGAWREYEEQSTPDARLVKQADRLETFLQSREYLAEDPALPMASFALQVADPTTLPDSAMRELRDAIERMTSDMEHPAQGEVPDAIT